MLIGALEVAFNNSAVKEFVVATISIGFFVVSFMIFSYVLRFYYIFSYNSMLIR